MASISRTKSFWNEKTIKSNDLEVEIQNLVNTWNNQDQGLQQFTVLAFQQFRPNVSVVTAAGTYVVVTADCVVVINKSVGAATAVTLPAAPNTNRMLTIKDGKGDAGTNNITISGNGKNIDGASTLVISSNFGVSRIVYNGTQWNVV